MKIFRTLALTATAVLATTVIGSNASAATTPAFCDEIVYVDPRVDTASQTDNLQSTINQLSDHGVDTRVFVMNDMLGASDFTDFRLNVFRNTCPNLVRNGDYATNLYMLFVFDDGAGNREMGGIAGGQFLRYFNEDDMFDAAIDKAGNGDYLGGLTDYLIEVEGNIDRASQPSPGPTNTVPRETSSRPTSDSESSWNWGQFLTILGIVLAIAMVIMTIVFIVLQLRHRKRRKAYLAQLQTRLDAAKQAWVDLGQAADSHNLDLNYLVDRLVDEEDQPLRDAKKRIDAAVGNFRDSLGTAQTAINEAGNDTEAENARTRVEEAEFIINDGVLAQSEVGSTIQEIKRLLEVFPAHMTETLGVIVKVEEYLEQLTAEGYVMTRYKTRLDDIKLHIKPSQDLFDRGAVVAASDDLEDIDNDVVALHAEMLELPKVPEQLRAESAKLKEQLEALETEAVSVEERLSSVLTTFNPQDTEGLEHSLIKAKYDLLVDSKDCIAQGDQAMANSLDPDDFDKADHFYDRTSAQMAEANQLLDEVQATCDRLDRLSSSLLGKLDALIEEAESLQNYANSVSVDLPDQLISQIDTVQHSAHTLRGVYVSTAKPELISTDDESTKLDKQMDELLAQAQRLHREQEKLRLSIKEARRNAIAKYEEAARYSRYVSHDYNNLSGMFNPSTSNVTLLQQLAYWQRVHQSATNVYDEGKRAHKRATTPVYTSPTRSSGGSSFSFGSSGGGSRSFSSGGGSRSMSSGGGSRKF